MPVYAIQDWKRLCHGDHFAYFILTLSFGAKSLKAAVSGRAHLGRQTRPTSRGQNPGICIKGVQYEEVRHCAREANPGHASLQFLPQDKVVEFAKLKPVDLLLETEKAVGDSTLHGKHEALIEERKELLRLEQVCLVSIGHSCSNLTASPRCRPENTAGPMGQQWCCARAPEVSLRGKG